MNPIDHLNQWLANEMGAGAPNPQQAVLSTATLNAIPHSRVVAVREINEEGLLFFTQRNTRKVLEMNANPVVSMTFWFEMLMREVIIEGEIETLFAVENEYYWQSYPREAQIRFHSYAPTSSQSISSKQVLEEKKIVTEQNYADLDVPMSPYYCGFRLKANRFVFYAYRTDELSDVAEYTLVNQEWIMQPLSP